MSMFIILFEVDESCNNKYYYAGLLCLYSSRSLTHQGCQGDMHVILPRNSLTINPPELVEG